MLAICAANSPTTRKSRPRRNGFSLLEIMIVLTIFSAVSVLSVASFTNGRDRLELDRQAGNLKAALTQARNMALTSGVSTYVQFFKEPAGVQIQSTGGDNGQIKRRDLGHDTLFLDPQDRNPGTPGRVYFYADGQSSGLKTILSIGNTERLITVDWLTGKSSVRRGDGDV